MTPEIQSTPNTGDEVAKAIGRLEGATDDLKRDANQKCGTDPEEVSNILALIGRTILKIFK